MLHDRLGYLGNVLDVPNPTHRTGTPSWSMHAAGIEFDHTFLVRQAPISNAVVVGIVLRASNYADGGVQCVPTSGQMLVGTIKIGEAVVRANDDGTLS
jgi:hypothetical protein